MCKLPKQARPPREKRPRPDRTARNAEIIRAKQAGATHLQAGWEWRLSTSQVGRIWCKHQRQVRDEFQARQLQLPLKNQLTR
jgi:hypothetical protein